MSAVTGPPALTTVFTAPASCASILTYHDSTFWHGQLSSSIGDPDCFPSEFSRAWLYYYSPGVCPSGWTSAGSWSGTDALVYNTAETNAACCPSSYFTVAGYCASTLPVGTITNVYSTSIEDLGPVPPNPTLTTMSVGAGITAWCDVIQVRWQSTDTEILALFSSETAGSSSSTAISASTSPTTSIPTTTGPTTTGNSPTVTGSPVPNAAHRTLSGGAIAGIVIGILAGALLLAGLLFWIRKRRRENHSEKAEDSTVYHPVPPSHELDAKNNETPLKGELDGNVKVEMDARNQAVELPGGQWHEGVDGHELDVR